MAVIEQALFNLVTNDATIAALISTRLYPNKLPQKPTLPALVYQRLSGPKVSSHDGSSGLAHPLFQFKAWDKKYSVAKDLAEKLRLLLQGYSGTVLGVNINGILFVDDHDLYEEDAEIHGVGVDYRIWHNEPKP